MCGNPDQIQKQREQQNITIPQTIQENRQDLDLQGQGNLQDIQNVQQSGEQLLTQQINGNAQLVLDQNVTVQQPVNQDQVRLGPVLAPGEMDQQASFREKETGASAYTELTGAFTSLESKGARRLFGLSSRDMDQVKIKIKELQDVFKGLITAKNFVRKRSTAIIALENLIRVAQDYKTAKIRDPENDTSLRHQSVLRIIESANKSMQFFESLKIEDFQKAHPDGCRIGEAMSTATQALAPASVKEVQDVRAQAQRARFENAPAELSRLNRESKTFDAESGGQYYDRFVKKLLYDPLPRTKSELKLRVDSLSGGLDNMIRECRKYIKNAKPWKEPAVKRLTMAKELLSVYTAQKAALEQLDVNKIRYSPKANPNLLSLIMPGMVHMYENEKGEVVTDDGRTGLVLMEEDEKSRMDLMISDLNGFLNVQPEVFRSAEPVLYNGKQRVMTRSLEQEGMKWTNMETLILEASRNNVTISYTEKALAQLTRLQIMDVLCGLTKRSQSSMKYLAKMQNVNGEQTLVIQEALAEDNKGYFGENTFEDLEKEARKDKGKKPLDVKGLANQEFSSLFSNEAGMIQLPYYDRNLAKAIESMDADAFLARYPELSEKQKEAFKSRLQGIKDILLKEKNTENSLTRKTGETEMKYKNAKIKRLEKKIEEYKKLQIPAENYHYKKDREELDFYKNASLEELENMYSGKFKYFAENNRYTGYAIPAFLGKMEEVSKEKTEEKESEQVAEKNLQKKGQKEQQEHPKQHEINNRIRSAKNIIGKFKAQRAKPGNSEGLRLQSKQEFKDTVAKEEKKKYGEEFRKAIKAFSDYANMDVTAQSGYYIKTEDKKEYRDYTSKPCREEAKKLKDAVDLAKARIADIEKKGGSPEELKSLKDLVEKAETMMRGSLKVPKNARPRTVDDKNFVEGTPDKEGEAYLPGTEKQYEWLDRTEEPLFAHEPTMNDVAQGHLGDCYAVSTIASLCEASPQAIKNMMKDNGDTVTVRFYSGGRPVFITVKKTVPAIKMSDGTREERFARGALWVQMLEKAYAASGLSAEVLDWKGGKHEFSTIGTELMKQGKISYDGIASGRSENFMKILTKNTVNTAEFETHQNENTDQFTAVGYTLGKTDTDFWELVKNKRPDVYITAGTKHDLEGNEEVGMNNEKMLRGIAGGHAYTVVGIREIDGEERIELRNPWGVGTVEEVYNEVTGATSIRKTKNATDAGSFFLTKRVFFSFFSHFASSMV